MGGAQALALLTLLGTLGPPRAMGRPTDVGGGPIDVGHPIDVRSSPIDMGHPMDVGRPIDVGHPIDVRSSPIDVGRPIDMGHPIDVRSSPIDMGHPMDVGHPMGVGRPMEVGHPIDMGHPLGVGRPIDVRSSPMEVGHPIDMGHPMGVGHPIDVRSSPMEVGHPLGVGRPIDVWGGPPAAWGGARPPCGPMNVTVSLEKDECPQCRAVTTTGCGGFCRTRAPVYRGALGPPPQCACVYAGVRYERRFLGGCPPGTDPAVPVPVAAGCRCARCPMAAADCTVRGLGPAFCGAPGGFGGQ